MHTIVHPLPAYLASRLQIKDTYMQPPFRVVIFSGGDPAHIHRLVTRIMKEVPEAQVCGVLCERRPGKTLGKRMRAFLQNLKRREFLEYATGKVVRNIGNTISSAGTSLLHLVHSGSPRHAPEMDPINVVNKDRNFQHGIPPKPPNIKPEPLDQPAVQRHLPPRYPKYPQKLPKKVGGGNYELL